MQTINRDTAIKKIMGMPQEQVAKVLIFMAGMEAEHCINAEFKAAQTSAELNVHDLLKESELVGK